MSTEGIIGHMRNEGYRNPKVQDVGERHTDHGYANREVKLHVAEGEMHVNIGGHKETIRAGQHVIIPRGKSYSVEAGSRGAKFVTGEWH